MVNAIYESQLSPQARQFLKKTGQPQPKYFCSSCSNLKNGNYCDCFHRPVDAGYNRCFNHTNYKPVTVAFKAPENLEEIVREEEKQNCLIHFLTTNPVNFHQEKNQFLN